MRLKKQILPLLFLLIIPGGLLKSQVLVESVAAIVGQEMVLLSDIEDRVYQERLGGDRRPEDQIRCDVLKEILTAKLFVDQSRIDSLIVNSTYVESDLNVRMNDAIRSAGSEQVLEDYFRKDIIEIREDIRKALIEQETVSEVQNSIVQEATVTPNEARKFYSSIPKDSLPIIPEKVQVSIIQLDAPDFEASRTEARQKLLDIRNKILEGQSFTMLAVLYSEDPGSASKGGEIGYMLKGELEKEYADAAFALQPNGISRIIETRYGFHLIQMIDKKEDMANTRHILIKPKVNAEQSAKAIERLDSLAQMIRRDSISFEDAARRFSTHKDSRTNGGAFVNSNPSDRNRWFELEGFNQDMYRQIRELNIGEISDPFVTTDDNGNTVYRIVRLDSEIPAHRANLEQDYQILYNGTLNQKQIAIFSDWIKEKIQKTYIKISDECSSCDFLVDEGWIKE